jgi:hypothetical protein
MLVAYLDKDFTLHTKYQKMYNVSAMVSLLYTMKKALCSLYPEEKVIEMLANAITIVCAIPSEEMLPKGDQQGMLYSTIDILSMEDLEDLEAVLRMDEQEFIAVFTSFGDTQSLFYSPKEDGILTAALFFRKLAELIKKDSLLITETLLRLENEPFLCALVPTMELVLGLGTEKELTKSLN